MAGVVAHEEAAGQGSFADLYVAHAPDGIRLAFLLIGDRTLAEDLVQDAFARLVGRSHHLRDRGAFGAYLRRTIVNLATQPFPSLVRDGGLDHSYAEPPVGPSVDDLVTGLAELAPFRVT